MLILHERERLLSAPRHRGLSNAYRLRMRSAYAMGFAPGAVPAARTTQPNEHQKTRKHAGIG